MKKCIVFSRCSTIGQKLESQTEVCIAEANKQGYSSDNIIVIEEKESGILLDISERKGIEKLKQQHDIDCIIIYEISRLSRRPKDLYELRDYFINNNIQLICLTPYFKLINNGKMDMMANIVFGLFTSMAENECLMRAERCRRGRLKAKQENRYIGGRLFFGYTLDNHKITINNEQADIVRYVYNHRDMTLNSLCHVLQYRKPFENKKFSTIYCMIRRIFLYESVYIGNNSMYPKIL